MLLNLRCELASALFLLGSRYSLEFDYRRLLLAQQIGLHALELEILLLCALGHMCRACCVLSTGLNGLESQRIIALLHLSLPRHELGCVPQRCLVRLEEVGFLLLLRPEQRVLAEDGCLVHHNVGAFGG